MSSRLQDTMVGSKYVDWILRRIGVKELMVFVKVVLKGNGSKGLRPQLVRCAPFPSIAPYFRML
jgi:hypothetical protein